MDNDDLESVLRDSPELRFLRVEPMDGSLVFVRQGLEYRASDPQREKQGLRVRLVCRNGDGNMLHQDLLQLASDLKRRQFARAVAAALPGQDYAALCNDVLMLGDEVERRLRELAEELEQKKSRIREPSAEEAARARELLSSPDLMLRVLEAIRGMGVVGEEYNALLLYLAYTSRITPRPVSIVIKGDSSSGKSWVQGRVLGLFPEECRLEASDITPQALFYLPHDLAHMIIAIAELPGADKADYSIRTAQSEGKLRILVTVRDAKTNEPLTKAKEVQGPVMFCLTTTHSTLNLENETRQFSLYTDDSVPQTRRIRELQYLESEGRPVRLPPEALQVWQDVQRILKPYPVLIPYVRDVGESFPDQPLRVRRDWARFCTLVEAVALLHQQQRQVREIDGQEWLVATACDYAYARELAQQVLTETITSIGPKSRELFQLMKDDEWADEARTEKREFSYRYLSEAFGLKRSAVQRWMRPLYETGFAYATIVGKSGAGRGNVARWVIADKGLAEMVSLVGATEIARRYPETNDLDRYQPVPFEPEVGL